MSWEFTDADEVLWEENDAICRVQAHVNRLGEPWWDVLVSRKPWTNDYITRMTYIGEKERPLIKKHATRMKKNLFGGVGIIELKKRVDVAYDAFLAVGDFKDEKGFTSEYISARDNLDKAVSEFRAGLRDKESTGLHWSALPNWKWKY